MRTARLKSVARVFISSVDKKSAEGELQVRLCNYTDVYYNDAIRDDSPFMEATATFEQVRLFRLQVGDVVITKDSETADDIAVPALVREPLNNVVCGYHLAIIRGEHAQIDGRYLFWVMSSRHIRERLGSSANGITRFGLRVDALADIRIPVPTLAEQFAIANYLDRETARIDALVAAKQRMVNLAELRLRAEVRQRVTSDALDKPWSALPLKRRWTLVDCKHITPDYVDEGYPVVSPGDVTPGLLNLERCHRFVTEVDYFDLTNDGRRPRRGDIIYSRNASIGVASYVATDQPFCMGQDVCLITSGTQDQRYLTYALNTVGLEQLEELKVGSTFSRINVDQIAQLKIPYPPPHQQVRIADRLDELSARFQTLRTMLGGQIELLVERRQALITAAVTGALEVPGVAA